MLADRIQSSVGLQEAGLWYFYWGAGSVAALPFLPKTVPLSVVRFHGSDLYGVAGYAPYQRELLSRVARVFTVSRAGEDHLLSLHGRVPPIKVMRLGTAQPSVRAVERQKSHEGFHIVSCARAVSLKRLPLIAQALRLFAESHLDDGESILWTHFGEGPDLAAVQRCSKPPHPRVTIKLMGDVENIKILEFYASVKVDGFVSVSSTEGIPVSMMEAASCGIPILSTDVGGCREVVGVETGVLISANPQLEEIASGMSDLLRGAFSSNGVIEFWAEFFDSDKNCGVVAHELRKLVP